MSHAPVLPTFNPPLAELPVTALGLRNAWVHAVNEFKRTLWPYLVELGASSADWRERLAELQASARVTRAAPRTTMLVTALLDLEEHLTRVIDVMERRRAALTRIDRLLAMPWPAVDQNASPVYDTLISLPQRVVDELIGHASPHQPSVTKAFPLLHLRQEGMCFGCAIDAIFAEPTRHDGDDATAGSVPELLALEEKVNVMIGPM